MAEKKRRIIAVLIILTIVAGAIGGLYIAKVRAKQGSIANAKGVLLDSAKEQADTLSMLFESNFMYLELLADSDAYENDRTDAETENMLAALQAHSEFSLVYITDNDGIARFGNNVGYDYSDRDYFIAAKGGERAISSIYGKFTGRNGVVLAVPYYKHGETVGVLCGMYYEESLMDVLAGEAFEGSGYSYLIDSTGEVVVRTTSDDFLPTSNNILTFFEQSDVKFENGTDAGSLRTSINACEPAEIYCTVGGDARVLAITPFIGDGIPDNDWMLCNVIAEGALSSQIDEASASASLAIGVVALFLALALCLFLLLERDNRRRVAETAELRNSFLDNLPCGAGVYRLMTDGRLELLYLNRRYYELVGRSGIDIERNDVTRVIHPDDVDMLKNELMACQIEKRDAVLELRILTGGGYYAPFRIIGHIAPNKDGSLIYYGLHFPVENGEFHAVRERQETEQRYRSLVDNSGGGLTITEVSESGKAANILTSDGMLRLMHTTRDAWNRLSQDDIYNKVYPDDMDAARSLFDKLRTDGETASAAYRLRREDGGYTWVSVTGRCAVENGRMHIYAVHTDITDQKLMEEKERGTSEQLTFLNRIAGDLLSETDVDASIHTVLRDILSYFSGKRAYIFEFENDRRMAHNTYEVCAQGVESAMELLESVPFSAFSEWFKLFDKYGYIAISDTSSLGAGRESERALLEEQQISSLIVVPLIENGRLTGMMGVDDPDRNAEQMERLQGIGNYISVMLARRNLTVELNDNNRRMEVMMSNTPGGFAQMLIHPDGSITPSFLNDGFCRMLGMTRRQVHDLFDTDAYAGAHPDDRALVSAPLEKAIKTHGAFTVRVRFMTAGGNYIPTEVYYRVWENTHGVLYLNGYYRDVSDKAALEENYRRNLAYRNMTGRNTMASFRLNVTKNIMDDGIASDPYILTFNSEGTLDGFLKNAASVLGDSFDHGEFLSRFSREALLNAAAQGRNEISLEHPFILDTKQRRWIRTIVELFKNPETGDVEGFIYARDLTEEHMLGLIMSTVVNVDYDFIGAVNLTTKEYRTFISNGGSTTALRDKGVYDDETLNDLIRIIHPDDRAAAYEAMRLDVIEERLKTESHVELHYRVIRGNGEVRNKKCIYTYLEGDRSHLLLSRMDETGAVRRMQTALDAAQKANAAKSDFLSHMSHEIRTPMNAIIGMTQLTLDEAKDAAARDGLLSIRASSEYLLSVINDILDMSRIESGKFTVEREWTSIADVMRPCIDMIEPAIAQKHIRFEYPSFDKVGAYEIFVDVLKTRQMFMNLLNNACKFTGEGGWIKFSCANVEHDPVNSTDLITVEDNGCGMSEEFLTRIFSPFAQERNIYSGSVQGTGLGLALTRQIARAMGGDITVKSKLGEGSKFMVRLTYRYRIKDTQEAPKKNSLPNADLKGCRVLLCEDNLLNATIATRLLEKGGLTVDYADNGRVGLDKFERSGPGYYDFILMDIRMPEMDGLSAARAIRALPRPDARTVPIIAMSANAFEEDVKASLDAGMNAHLAKPVDWQKLYATLCSQLEARGT